MFGDVLDLPPAIHKAMANTKDMFGGCRHDHAHGPRPMKILDCQKERHLPQFLCVPIGRYLVELTCERSCDLYRDVILQIGCELIWRGWMWWWRRDTTWRIGGDRKRVVQGKSVAVRVDLGGRRHIKKK